jgi:hypothetical protein
MATNQEKHLIFTERYSLVHLQLANLIHPVESITLDHNIQNIPKQDFIGLLGIIKECLTVGGVLKIKTPDFYKMTLLYPNKASLDTLSNYFLTEPICCIYDFISIQKVLVQAGFFGIRRFDAESKEIAQLEVQLNVEAYR